MTTSPISMTVMRRVRFVHFVRPLFSGVTLAALVLVLALWGVGREVWVAHVFQNMPPLVNIGAVVRFYLAAFVNTRLVVQMLVLVALAAFVWGVRDGLRLVLPSRRYA